MSATLTDNELEELGACVTAIGTPDFPRLISRFCASLCSADTVFLSAFFDDQKPVGLYGNHTDESQKESLKLYLDVAYVLDPFYLLFRQRRGDQVLSLDEVAPDDFKQSEYYAKFFRDMALTDECGLMLHIEDDAALFFSMGTQAKGARADPTRLNSARPLISALARRHWTRLTPANTDGSGRLSAQIHAAFEAFGSSVLSPREGDVLRMILQGHSSKSIAARFNNSPETIKVHRKRIYAKLSVTSQGELLSMFLSALSKMPPTADGDPLQFLHVG
ncbi:MAG: helix-turn-helix transcriptional regulator [Boseongicola sp. SB0673_bin_14]|nr:helix-turn-helix transcriptional regulator [Boseongicola sp. SB0667_bin_21]MYI68474.1 helix-turn-helix transcriptional regulator [Boseongicola sp. SB0673_bin_14]